MKRWWCFFRCLPACKKQTLFLATGSLSCASVYLEVPSPCHPKGQCCRYHQYDAQQRELNNSKRLVVGPSQQCSLSWKTLLQRPRAPEAPQESRVGTQEPFHLSSVLSMEASRTYHDRLRDRSRSRFFFPTSVLVLVPPG